jgi:hypothetical protein
MTAVTREVRGARARDRDSAYTVTIVRAIAMSRS